MAFKLTKIFDVNRKKDPPFKMDQPEILKMTVIIRLSSAQYITAVQSSLDEVLHDLDFEENGNEITVSAYPPIENFGEDNILAIVQGHDPNAVAIQRPPNENH